MSSGSPLSIFLFSPSRNFSLVRQDFPLQKPTYSSTGQVYPRTMHSGSLLLHITASSSADSYLSTFRTLGWILSGPGDLLTSDLLFGPIHSVYLLQIDLFFLTYLLQSMHQSLESDNFCCKKNLESSLSFLHLLQPP